MAPIPERIRIAIVGCGAVTQQSLLPVVAGHERMEIVALVDRNLDRARTLGAAYGVSRIHSDMGEIGPAEVDGVIIATPPAHHAPATLDAIGRGWHVFVEKPMAVTASDADAMVSAADEARVSLVVGLYRRLLPVTRLLRALLESEMLGPPRSVDLEEGGEYSWELASLSVLTREGGGGGVLIDLGTHLLDQLFYLLPGAPAITRYLHNARGGVETDCVLELSLGTRWGAVPARVELSRTRQLRGTIRVECERGALELVRGDFCNLLVHATPRRLSDPVTGKDRAFTISASWSDEQSLVGYKAFRAEFDDWLNAIHTRAEAQLSGRSVLPVVGTIQSAYASPVAMSEPWVDGGLAATGVATRAPAVVTGTRPRVLVTGAGGFLGCRTVECLHLGGAWDVRALVRRPGSAARLARWPVEIVLGDVTSQADIVRAAAACDAVVHCAVGTGWPPEATFRTTVEGTRATASGALEAGVKRFVHVSSMAVHGWQVPPRLDEAVPLVEGSGFDYGRAKFLAERAVAEVAARGLRAIVLRPARIYGPFSRTFTTRPLEALREGRLVLAGDAESPANMVYVDNVVEAIVRALVAPDTECGEAFLVSEADQLSWRAFFEYFAEGTDHHVMVTGLPPADENPVEGLVRRWRRGLKEVAFSSELRQLAKRVLWTDPVGTWPRRWWERSPGLQRRVQRTLGIDAAVTYREPLPAVAELVEFRIDPTLVLFEKAAARLGYRSVVGRDEALRLTRAWAHEARLI